MRPSVDPARLLRSAAPLALVSILALGCSENPGEAGTTGDAAVAPTDATATPDAAPAAGPDIWLAELVWGDDGRPSLQGLRNATDRPGYDNQPSFFPDGWLYYTRQEGVRTEIWRLDPGTGDRVRVTRTDPESEYSPTPVPSGDAMTAIQVEADSLQRLWRIDLDGAPVAPVFEELAPVGYHAWIDDDRVAMFVLGSPATLQIGRVSTQEVATAASGIGRSLHALADRDAISFPLMGESGATISIWEDGQITPLVESLEGSQDHAWGNGLIFQASEGRLFTFDPDRAEEGWVQVADLTDQGLTLSRLAVSPDGGRIALVADRTGG